MTFSSEAPSTLRDGTTVSTPTTASHCQPLSIHNSFSTIPCYGIGLASRWRISTSGCPCRFESIQVPLHGFTLAAHEMYRNCYTSRIPMTLPFSARELLQPHEDRHKFFRRGRQRRAPQYYRRKPCQRIWRDHLNRNELCWVYPPEYL
jgi:hypothetical protein